MTNPSKRKGSSFEREVADYLKVNGFPLADRKVMRGNKDCGDIAGVPDWTLELKAERSMNLSAAVREAHVEAVNADTAYFAAVIKKPRARVSEAYVVMPLWLFAVIAR